MTARWSAAGRPARTEDRPQARRRVGPIPLAVSDLTNAIASALNKHPTILVVDLTDVTILGSSTLFVLVEAEQLFGE